MENQIHKLYLIQRGKDDPETGLVRADSELLQLFPRMNGIWEDDKKRYIEHYNEVDKLVHMIEDEESNLAEDEDSELYVDDTLNTEEYNENEY